MSLPNNKLTIVVENPTCADASVENSDASYSVDVSSGDSLVLPDVTIEILDQFDVVIDTDVIPSVKDHLVDVFQYCPVADVENSDASYATTVVSGGTLILPDQSIQNNGVASGFIPSVGTINVTTNVAPTSFSVSGRTIDIVVPAGSSPSGVQFQFPIPIQRTSYRTGDEGWRVQNGWYDYTPPAMPKVVAELDYTITNWADTLSSALIVNGVSSTNRFVDAFGAKIAGGASVVIDKLQGVAFTRSTINKANWNAAIDDALTFSVTVNSITFADWYCVGLNDILPTTRMEASVGFAQLIDLSAQLFIFSNNVYTATTNPANTAQMWHVVFSSRNYTAIDKTFGISAIYVHDAKNLITAP
jgi:hypothetical protein